MAVFTTVTPAEARDWLQQFDLGRLESLEGIASGIENTNYFLTTDTGEFVLTIFEKLTHAQLPFYLEFMRSLAGHGINVPCPMANRKDEILLTLKQKPCALATRLRGRDIVHPNTAHCADVGDALARMHLAGLDYQTQQPTLMQPNLRGLAWWLDVLPQVCPHLPPALQSLLREEVHAQADFAQMSPYQQLQQGPVHADLFRNNVLFDGTTEAPKLGGFIDFYFAGVDTWLFDLAVTVNDWCIDLATGEFDEPRLSALLMAYAEVRPFTDAEHEAWNMMLRAAALRFWMSRLYDFYLPRAAQSLTPHDPTHFERVLRLRRLAPTALPH